jgi:hypothetical protein
MHCHVVATVCMDCAMAQVVAGLSPWRSRFTARSVHLGFVVDKVALGLIFFEFFSFSQSISFLCSPPLSHIIQKMI